MIQNGVKTISFDAFACSHSLKTVVIPESVQQIDESAFKNARLENMIFKGRAMGDVQQFHGYPWGQRQDSIKPELTAEF